MAALVALLCLGQVVLWGAAAGLLYQAPEVDSAEQFVWAFSMENGYWKHPPLPSWIMHALMRVFGPSVALPFVATQTCIVVALAIAWRLGCEFMSPRRALIAMALTSLVAYHNIGGDSFNHNTVLLPFQAATLLSFYLATRRGTWRLWALTGVFAGLSLLVKYVALVPLAGMLIYLFLDQSLHTRRSILGVLLAVCTLALVVLPHLLWLLATDFLPVHYARSVTQSLTSASAVLTSLGGFLLLQLLRLIPFLFGLWFVVAKRRTDPTASEVRASPASCTPTATRDQLFIWTAAVSPLGITLCIGLFGETALQGRWGTNAFLLSGMLAMLLLQRADTPQLLRRTLLAAVAIQVSMCMGQTLSKTVIAAHFMRATRANFPGASLAQNAQETWNAHTNAPLRLVASDIWLGGNLVANSPQRLAVLIDGEHQKSPWIKDNSIDTCGALIVQDITEDNAGHAPPGAALQTLMARADARGVWVLPWAHARSQPGGPTRAVIRWGILVPKPGTTCALGDVRW